MSVVAVALCVLRLFTYHAASAARTAASGTGTAVTALTVLRFPQLVKTHFASFRVIQVLFTRLGLFRAGLFFIVVHHAAPPSEFFICEL